MKPDWAQLTRLAGDRVAILFEYLRSQLSGIDGLVEDLHFESDEEGWTPRYRVGQVTLFTAMILPGALEATVEFAEPLRRKLLVSPGIGPGFKAALREGPSAVRVRLGDRAAVRAFVRAVRMKNRWLAKCRENG